ncbi:MAG: aminoacyl-tRNA hydrolase [Treponema sp.]|jgi:ribosome-associated protein|nr:aminoacyl-tRNA hydrolase [Treponema sp.]
MNGALLHTSIRGAAEISYCRSRGPGGQNVNKVNTKVTLRIRLGDLEGLSAGELGRLRETLASRITADNALVLSCDGERSQKTNRERAFVRLETLIIASARLPKYRRPTKPSKQAREQRLQSKRLQGLKKMARGFAEDD